MKILIKISIIISLLISTNAIGQKINMVKAGTDEFCNNTSGVFTVPEDCVGFQFEFKLIPGSV